MSLNPIKRDERRLFIIINGHLHFDLEKRYDEHSTWLNDIFGDREIVDRLIEESPRGFVFKSENKDSGIVLYKGSKALHDTETDYTIRCPNSALEEISIQQLYELRGYFGREDKVILYLGVRVNGGGNSFYPVKCCSRI